SEFANKLLTIPNEHSAYREHDTHQIPHTRHNVTKNVRAKPKINARLGSGSEHSARRSPTCNGLPRRHNAHTSRATCVIDAATHDRRSEWQSDRGGNIGGHRAENFGRSADFGNDRVRKTHGIEN